MEVEGPHPHSLEWKVKQVLSLQEVMRTSNSALIFQSPFLVFIDDYQSSCCSIVHIDNVMLSVLCNPVTTVMLIYREIIEFEVAASEIQGSYHMVSCW